MLIVVVVVGLSLSLLLVRRLAGMLLLLLSLPLLREVRRSGRGGVHAFHTANTAGWERGYRRARVGVGVATPTGGAAAAATACRCPQCVRIHRDVGNGRGSMLWAPLTRPCPFAAAAAAAPAAMGASAAPPKPVEHPPGAAIMEGSGAASPGKKARRAETSTGRKASPRTASRLTVASGVAVVLVLVQGRLGCNVRFGNGMKRMEEFSVVSLIW